jgi:Hint domain
VIAMAGILASTVATIGTTTIAHAGWGRRWSGHSDRYAGRGGSCFLCGTKILTDVDETAIENLEVGDLVSTVSGQLRPIKRVISWKVERQANQDWTDDVAPIKVCRSALAPNVPHRDLYLSPAHALYLDGVLMRVSGLVNGRSIVCCSKREEDRLSYFHLEFEDHQVILAEGAPVESALGNQMIPLAPIWFDGRRSELASRLRSAISPWIDRRKVVDKVRDRLEVQGESDLAA